MKKLYILLLLSTLLGYSQVGIGTTAPQGALDITSATNGMLVPRVALTAINVSAPVVNPQGGALTSGTLVWNTATAGVFPNNVVLGFYYWNGTIWISVTGAAANAWSLTGNGGTNGGTITTAGTNFIGTTDAQNIDIRTNNTFRGRFSSLGEFFIGTLNTSLPGDLMNGVGNTTFPWAVNGYTSNNGGATYGLRQTGSIGTWGAIQGELDSTLPVASSGVNGTVSATSHYGVRGFKPAGGSGFGGIFYNDLGYTGGFYFLSDKRLKKNIKPLTNVLETIKSIPFYTYNFKTEEYDILGGEEMHYGVMANELLTILPSLVKTKIINAGNIRSVSIDKQPKSVPFEVNAVNYLELIPIAIQGIKEQQKIIEDLNDRITTLEKIILTKRH